MNNYQVLISMVSIGVSYTLYSMDIPKWKGLNSRAPVVELSVYNAQKDKIAVVYKIAAGAESGPIVLQPLANSSSVLQQGGASGGFELKNTTDSYVIATQTGIFEIGITDKHTAFTSYWPYNHRVGNYVVPLENNTVPLDKEKQKFIIIVDATGKPLLTPVG